MENLTPETRLEGYLAKMTGQTSETLEPKTRLEYYLNKIAENSSATSDLGTVEVTIVNETTGPVYGDLPRTESQPSVDFTETVFVAESMKTSTFSAITYKGNCVIRFNPDQYPNYDIATSGAVYYEDGTGFITGNCTLTVSDKLSPPAV